MTFLTTIGSGLTPWQSAGLIACGLAILGAAAREFGLRRTALVLGMAVLCAVGLALVAFAAAYGNGQ